ncbi:nitrite reductase small subunit NirD [Microbacterium kyungheense]|jgi:nitrite reductase (NADH) small subunit|uniref:Assimilatory nitrite reductase (NAD(P)H) small subunit n=1 Tax=Microbacterium kyungheense TaxID=1263636 RepID=A0A543F2J2_9MICO|nr:nitrite reductase small subunit NirD [Microbacterium kyungheense]TQM28046.1 assimilatory nitrite reductase (NAD(P)H) small subunit [Microbacterium kyungheense]TQM28057.1 nitrite reductase (NADH) small subunit [Microbacterium kyungheense]TQM28061.1 nitrite reductase (NADH) small subunit [Microbacterium kyungheense]
MTLIDPQTTAHVAPPGWVRVCALTDLEIERGRAALLGGTQIALFLTRGADGRDGRVYAVSNFDPFSRANVISRGIVGTRQDAPTVASPMFKQVFDLRTGICLDAQGKDPVNLHVWPTAVADGMVLVRWDEPADGSAP